MLRPEPEGLDKQASAENGAGAAGGWRSERPLRASSYTIYVDLPNSTELLLVHGYLGTYDRVSRDVANYVRSLDAQRPPRPLYGEWVEEPAAAMPADTSDQPPRSITAALVARGYLTTLSVEEEAAQFAKASESLHRTQSGYLSYVVMPTYDCNLRCPYCFQDYMRTNPTHHQLLRTMTPSMADRIVLGMQSLESQHGMPVGEQRPRRVMFFGGEPLLARSRPIVEYLIRKLQALGPVTITAVTNGTELDAYCDLLGPGGISAVQITLDGPPKEHDMRRVHADGTGSFDAIAKNIQLALSSNARVAVRMNVDRNNIEQLPQLCEEFRRCGWHESPLFSAYISPIVASNGTTERSTTYSTWELDKALWSLRQRFPAMAYIQGPDDRLKQQARRIFAEAARPPLKAAFCEANMAMCIFDAFGDIYACWERTGDPKIRIGHVQANGDVELAPQMYDSWRLRTVANNPICSKCRYALHCGGGCAVIAEARRGHMKVNWCDGFAARFRAMTALGWLEHHRGEALPTDVPLVCER